MARILITSGPTRQYLDPVRYLTNSSSGKMGQQLAAAALAMGHEVIVVSGPVEVTYPHGVECRRVTTTSEMLETCQALFPSCDGLIGAAAPCDYEPVKVASHKIAKTGDPRHLELWETPDIVASLGAAKRADQWTVGFALETEDPRFKALAKLERKACNLIVLNGPEAMNSDENRIEILDPRGDILLTASGSKADVAKQILQVIQTHLVRG